MKYNLLENSYVSSNTIIGNVSLSVENVENILALNGAVTISGADNDILCIDVDMGDRIAIYQMRYYFDSVTASDVVASGIEFYYKTDDVTGSGIVNEYLGLTTNIGSGFYYTTIPQDYSAPRYVRVIHTVSGTSITGDVVGFSVLNDDTVVDFGPDGSLESTTVLTSLSYLDYNDYIREIEIYNDGSEPSTAHVMFEPQYRDVDELMSISASENGFWMFARNTDYIISNGDNYDSGRYDNTSTSVLADGKLRLDTGYTVGTYTTPIFKNDSVKFAYIDMLSTSISGAIIAVDDDDYTSTIQIRSSSSKPIDYNVYRKFLSHRPAPGLNYYFYRDYLLDTDTLVFDSLVENGDYFATDFGNGTYSYTQILNACSINVNGRCLFINVWNGSAGDGVIELFLLYNSGLLKASTALSSNSNRSGAYAVYFVELDSNDNIWLYVYFPQSSNLGSAGYYLLHYDDNLSLLYKEYSSSYFLIGVDTVKDDSGGVWYTRTTGTQAVIKISSTGTVLLTYDDVTTLGRLCSTYDGGCWFIDGDSLYKLNSSGVLEDSITNLEIGGELTWVMRDESDYNFLWIVVGAYVMLISLDGRIYKSVYLEEFTIKRLYSTKEFLVVYCIDAATGEYYTKTIGKVSGGVDKTIAGSWATQPDDPGMKIISYDSPILGDAIPLSDDPVWNNSLQWNKSITANTVLPHEEYHQLRLTLRRPSIDIDSPTVQNIYYQDSVEITNIYPGQSKTLYLKISLPDGVSVGGDYSSMLRVWWEIPVN